MSAPFIILIDNYDSFAYNLARYAQLAGARVQIIRNDARPVTQILSLRPDGIILSPGPGHPKDAGVCIPLLRAAPPTLSILGVCLGHQAIAEAFGGHTKRTPYPMHGRASTVHHNGQCALFEGIEAEFEAGRYHSLSVELTQTSSPSTPAISPCAISQDGTIMAIQHLSRPIYGVQFHPESLLTPCGQKILQNFIQPMLK